MRDLGALGGSGYSSNAFAINSSGQIVGNSGIPYGQRAFLWESGVMSDLGVLPEAPTSSYTAYGINDFGQVVGRIAGGHALLWESGIAKELGSLHDPYSDATSEARAINNSGQVVGKTQVPEYYSIQEHAALWENGATMPGDLGTLGEYNVYSRARAINASGKIVGESGISGGTATHAFLWENGMMTDLGTLPGEAM